MKGLRLRDFDMAVCGAVDQMMSAAPYVKFSKIGALSPDGIIEAIESTDPNWFCIGVQWHPESDTASALDMQLFECFVQAAVRNAQPLAVAA